MFNFLSLTALLDPTPTGDFLIGFPLIGLFVIATFSGGWFKKRAQNNKYLKKSIRKKFWKFTALGIIGLLLVACRLSEIPYFSMRLWLLIVTLLTIILAFVSGFRIHAEYQKRLASVQREKDK